MRHRAVATLLAPYLVSRPHRQGLDAAVEPRADDLEEETLNDLSGFVIDDLEIDGPAAVYWHQGSRCDPVGFIPPATGRTMSEHQPETDAAPELNADGKHSMRQRSDQVLVGPDHLGHAGGLRIGLHSGCFDIDLAQGVLGSGNPAIELGRLDGRGAILLCLEQGLA